jgi:hypothetical protein
LRTPAVRVHGGAVVVPVSNPPFTIRFVVPPVAFTVRLIVVVCVSVPEVPVTVTDAVPVVAVELAVNVKTLVLVVGLVPKAAVTPEGRPEAERDTLPVKPPEGVSVIVLVAVDPWVTLTLAGDAESEKSGVAAALMVSEMVAVCVRVPEVPVTVTVEVPVVAVELAVKVKALLPVVGFVPNVAVTPEGNAEVDNVTAPVNPPEGVSVMVLLPLVPRVTVRLAGEAERVKFGAGAPAGGRTQLLAELENSNWIVYVVPLATYEPCWALHISPISPFVMSYQARGAAKVVAIPTSASVKASVNSWLVTDV